jgi:hypothetical protein
MEKNREQQKLSDNVILRTMAITFVIIAYVMVFLKVVFW